MCIYHNTRERKPAGISLGVKLPATGSAQQELLRFQSSEAPGRGHPARRQEFIFGRKH